MDRAEIITILRRCRPPQRMFEPEDIKSQRAAVGEWSIIVRIFAKELSSTDESYERFIAECEKEDMDTREGR